MLCDNCKQKEANVFIEQFINGERKVLHLCQDCAGNAQMPVSFSDVFQGFLYNMQNNSNQSNEDILKCDQCGLTYMDLKKTGKLGCSHCYETFEKELKSIFGNIQSNEIHRGKFPRKSGEALLKRRELENLKASLRKAVEKEAYEDAAKLRDEIKNLESNGGA